MKRRLKLLPPLLPVALSLILCAPFLFGGKVLYWGVYMLQFFPWRQLAVEQIRAGHWPLWNPYLGAGTPLAANLQTAAFYPLNILFLLMPVEQAFGWEMALHISLAGIFAYYLGRTLGMSAFGALVAGLAYAGGGYIVARWVFPSMVYAAAWLPLMLALTDRMLRGLVAARQPAVGSTGAGAAHQPPGLATCAAQAGFLALVIAVQLLAGHAQTSFYSLIIIACFALFRLIQRSPGVGMTAGIRQRLIAAGSLAVAVIWGIALAAIQLLPTAELAAHSQRAGALTDLRFAYELSFWPWRLITLLAPDFFGNPARGGYWAYGTYWEEAAFVGVLPLMLAVSAVASWRRRRGAGHQHLLALVPFLSILSILSLVLALGEHTPLYPLFFRYVPGFGLFQAPARLMIGYALGVAMLAGIGADRLSISALGRTAWRIAGLVGLGIGLAGAVARLALPAINPSFGSSAIRLGLTLGLAAALLLLRGRRLWGARWQMAAVALIAADLLAFGWGLAPGTDPDAYQDPVSTAAFLQSQPAGRLVVDPSYAQEIYDEYVSLKSVGPADPTYLQGLRESLMPNLNAAHHLPGAGNYDPLTVRLYRDLWDRIEGEKDNQPTLNETWPLLNLFGVRYVISDDGLALPAIYDAGPRIYRNDAALPEVFTVQQARIIEDKAGRLEALLDPSFNPHETVLLSRAPVNAPGLWQAWPEGARPLQPELYIARKRPDRIVILVNMVRAGYLVLNDTYYPGWQAIADGQAVEILQANHAFRTVALDAGEHVVIFQYAPTSFRVGAWITVGAMFVLVASLITGWLRRRAP